MIVDNCLQKPGFAGKKVRFQAELQVLFMRRGKGSDGSPQKAHLVTVWEPFTSSSIPLEEKPEPEGAGGVSNPNSTWYLDTRATHLQPSSRRMQ